MNSPTCRKNQRQMFLFVPGSHICAPQRDTNMVSQHAKKVVSDSPGLVDSAIGQVNSVFNLSDGQVIFLRNSSYRRTVKSILLIKKLLGLVEMTSGLVNTRFSLSKWQVVKMIFFAPCVSVQSFINLG